jgi:hypothetical protein
MTKFLLFLILLPLCCLSQKQGNIWYFGDHAGLNFNNGTPVALTNGQTYSPDGTSIEGSAVISDSSGALLFYTNGTKVWTKNHQLMPNGTDLLGNFSSTQSSLIIAQPESDRFFYIFTTDDFYVDNLQYGFRYSVVDMCLNHSMGDIVFDQKNILLLDTVAEKLTAVKHANGADYWIIVHKYYSDAFYSFRLTSTGIVDTVISHAGSRHPPIASAQSSGQSLGYLKASPNGQKLATVNGNAGEYTIAEYFDFDKSTGIVSNCVNLQTNLAAQAQFYGVSFSPDNTKLYISCWLNGLGIYQFDLNASNGNADSVIASKTKITANINSNNWAMQLATDGKIYIAGSGRQYLAAINNPNSLGTGCNYQDSAIYLNGKICHTGLPNFIDSYDYENTKLNICTVSNDEDLPDNDFIIYPNPFSYSTTIYSSEPLQNTMVCIYNSLGQVVNQIQGIYGQSAIINRNNLPAGLYFYKIVENGKMIISGKFIIAESY